MSVSCSLANALEQLAFGIGEALRLGDWQCFWLELLENALNRKHVL